MVGAVVRIIAGTKKSLRIDAPKGTVTRPMTDRMRESLFSSLASRIPQARVADLFAGSGSIGLEALSRGAESVVFVEANRDVVRVLRSNVERIGLGGSIVAATVESFLSTTHDGYDLVFVDPPYPMEDADVDRIVNQVARILADDGLVILHRRFDQPKPVTTLSIMHERRYGDAVIWRFEKDNS
ncbi:16S rRNA (guanine(966)-N(2))-methyltransferase [hydrothermal vent metagenome]|uniref:16S rRNA (Guanine(966)-N(2))-methyltransferase n=1 Tax=hydrothermal vent metagenome TaxID=652676 RepID=A0A3B0SPC3_9ZZZZ